MRTWIVVGCIAAVIATIAVLYTFSGMDNTGVQRWHGDISTAMASPILGSPDAPITIVEFGDFQCHACHAWHFNSKPAIMQNYVNTGKANIVFVDLAFLGRDSPRAAQASYCAEDQGMYWQYHDILYENQEERIDSWAGTERLEAFAFSLGLDMELFEGCLDSEKYSKRVLYNIGEARKAGATSTPTFFIIGPGGEQKIVGAQPYSIFEQVLDSMV